MWSHLQGNVIVYMLGWQASLIRPRPNLLRKEFADDEASGTNLLSPLRAKAVEPDNGSNSDHACDLGN
jgi:hypothetical protein